MDGSKANDGDTPTTAPTRDASDVYDRQIRLWGAEAQVCMLVFHNILPFLSKYILKC